METMSYSVHVMCLLQLRCRYWFPWRCGTFQLFMMIVTDYCRRLAIEKHWGIVVCAWSGLLIRYVMNKETGEAFFLTACIYTNSNGISRSSFELCFMSFLNVIRYNSQLIVFIGSIWLVVLYLRRPQQISLVMFGDGFVALQGLWMTTNTSTI